MGIVVVTVLVIVVLACGEEPPGVVELAKTVQVDNDLANTDLVAAFVVGWSFTLSL